MRKGEYESDDGGITPGVTTRGIREFDEEDPFSTKQSK